MLTSERDILRYTEQLQRDCPEVRVALQQASDAWIITGLRDGRKLIEASARHWRTARKEFADAYVSLLERGFFKKGA